MKKKTWTPFLAPRFSLDEKSGGERREKKGGHRARQGTARRRERELKGEL